MICDEGGSVSVGEPSNLSGPASVMVHSSLRGVGVQGLHRKL